MKTILDINVLLGRWPFMPLKYDNVAGVLTLMDRAGIDKGVVTSLNSVFYYDYEIGNREVGDACQQYPDRFIPFAVINPNFCSWQEHLRECIDEYGIRGIKLHPDYHKFSLLRERASEVMQEARELDLPVYIQTSLLDLRHHPGYCFVAETPISEVATLVSRYWRNTFIIAGGKHFQTRVRELINSAGKRQNFFLATDGIGGPFDGLGPLAEQIGSSRLLFGTRIPILYAEASKLLLEQSKISPEDKSRIMGANATEILGLAF
jgi:predicted TIM-barrel fold metal-dependent hydrolase